MAAIKMIRDRDYIFESFSSGESGVELISGKTSRKKVVKILE